MPIPDWPARWEALRRACDQHNATGRWAEGVGQPPTFLIGPPSSDREIAEVETTLGCPIPASVRNVFLKYSAATRIEWALPEGTVLPEPFRQIWSGEARWDLLSLPELMETYKKWIEVFPDPNDYWDGPWHNKVPVLEVGNGDMLGIDLGEQPAVVYISHEGDDSVHGYWLGSDFEDYVDRLSLIGCVGSEDWQLKPFVSGRRSFLEPDGENALRWRKWFGFVVAGDD